MAKEKWRPIAGLPDHEVSDRGRVRSWRGRFERRRKPTIRKTATHPRSGHVFVTLRYTVGDRKQTNRYVHHLVLEAFIGPRPDGGLARHRNGNEADNRAGNLLWGTRRDNYDDAVRMGEVVHGERHPMSKLTESKVRAIRKSTRPGWTLAKRYRVSQATVSMIRSRKIWARLDAQGAA